MGRRMGPPTPQVALHFQFLSFCPVKTQTHILEDSCSRNFLSAWEQTTTSSAVWKVRLIKLRWMLLFFIDPPPWRFLELWHNKPPLWVWLPADSHTLSRNVLSQLGDGLLENWKSGEKNCVWRRTHRSNSVGRLFSLSGLSRRLLLYYAVPPAGPSFFFCCKAILHLSRQQDTRPLIGEGWHRSTSWTARRCAEK